MEAKMNGKASVSKDLEARHSKILEGLLKLPENRQCADYQNKAPRWASVNLGIFICMQCAGIHRSLGVHISKLWAMGGPTSSGKHSCHQILTEVGLRHLSVPIKLYEDRRWAQKGATQPTGKPVDMNSNANKFLQDLKGGIPTKTRTLSLEEEILTKHIAQMTIPQMRPRGASFDTNEKVAAPAPPKVPMVTAELKTPAKKTNGTTNLYTLLYVNNVNQENSSVAPPCKTQNLY